ncbi:uncharacterized protein LOC110973609 [Acanthaster planci]|uniref:Uncharacterized protein LOC110973609 n=1 Tax=Acanthaster planci TaxID=133434 RepID=A0A8B7XHF1_ACAPL|nr:uncharacterized protein LOC110973609 [Acanthaster planci]
MVYETADDMSAMKKLSLRKGIKSPFSRKSSKKTTRLNATGTNVVVGDDCAIVASPILEETAADMAEVSSNSQPDMDTKTQSVTTKGSCGKSNKWPFRSRRSEDNGNVETEPKTGLSDGSADNGEPGSTVENNGGKKGTVSGNDARAAVGNQPRPPAETGTKHQFQKNVKVAGYVVPLRRQHDQSVLSVSHKASHSLGDTTLDVSQNGFHDEEDAEMLDQCDTSSRDFNGNPPVSTVLANGTKGIPHMSTDALPHVTRERPIAPELPPPLKNHQFQPELPPRIPPKPASLRYRQISSTEPCSSFTGTSEELDDDLPPRPPARPKNRTLGKGSLRPWNNLRDDARDNRATVYETVSLEPKEASLAKELSRLPRQAWYWGPLTQAQAEEKLAKLPDGSFLVRDSSDERYLLSLSFNSHGRTLHTRIEHRGGLFSLNDSDGHASVVELIECAVKESRNGVYGYMRDALGVQSFPARLTNWVSRFTEMRSLQHLCRFLIREVYPRHHIQRLPLPKKIKEYILENQY